MWQSKNLNPHTDIGGACFGSTNLREFQKATPLSSLNFHFGVTQHYDPVHDTRIFSGITSAQAARDLMQQLLSHEHGSVGSFIVRCGRGYAIGLQHLHDYHAKDLPGRSLSNLLEQGTMSSLPLSRLSVPLACKEFAAVYDCLRRARVPVTGLKGYSDSESGTIAISGINDQRNAAKAHAALWQLGYNFSAKLCLRSCNEKPDLHPILLLKQPFFQEGLSGKISNKIKPEFELQPRFSIKCLPIRYGETLLGYIGTSAGRTKFEAELEEAREAALDYGFVLPPLVSAPALTGEKSAHPKGILVTVPYEGTTFLNDVMPVGKKKFYRPVAISVPRDLHWELGPHDCLSPWHVARSIFQVARDAQRYQQSEGLFVVR